MRFIPRIIQKTNWVLLAILAIGLALRLWGIGFGLPYTIAPDEPNHFSIALHIFKTGDLNPHWLNYPSLLFYFLALSYIPYFLIGKWLGVFGIPADIPPPEVLVTGVGRLAFPSEFLWSRGFVVIFGLLSIFLIYRIARESYPSIWVAYIAACLVAISPALVYNSHLIRPDTQAVFFAIFSFMWARRVLDDASWKNYFLSALGVGLAVSSKYNLPLACAPLVAAHFLRFGWQGWKRREIYMAGMVSVAAYLITTPFTILDFPLFWNGFSFEIRAQATGHSGWEGNTLLWYLNYLWTTEGLVAVIASFQMIRLLLQRSKSGLVLLLFPLSYFIFINLFVVRNDRTLLPVLPFLHLLAAIFIFDAREWLTFRLPPRIAIASSLAAFALILYIPIQTTWVTDLRLTQMDSRDTAREWLATNLPPGTRIAQEAYTPYLDRTRYAILGLESLTMYPPNWYAQNGFEYLVFSQGLYGQFYADPERYPAEVAKYDEIFSRLQLVKQFNDNNYEVRVYKTTAILPSQRVAARYGDYGDLIELVGYETQLDDDGTLHLKFWWRPLRESPEPLELETLLLGPDDHEFAKVREDLFRGKGWQDEMFVVDWLVPLSSKFASGPYRLQMNVVQTRYSYNVPAQDSAGNAMNPVILGAFKIK